MPDKKPPSLDQWMTEFKALPCASQCGMVLCHNGVVRESAKAKVRQGQADTKPVRAMQFSYDAEKLAAVLAEGQTLPGIYHIRAWLAQGELAVGDDIMRVLIAGDIRPNVVAALEHIVGRIKSECVEEKELY